MTKQELINALEDVDGDLIVVVADENGGWDNIIQVGLLDGMVCIVFDGGSPFSDE